MADTLSSSLEKAFTKHVQDIFRNLLQDKHLYQSITISPNEVINPILLKNHSPIKDKERLYFDILIEKKWNFYDQQTKISHQARGIENLKYGESYITLQPPDVKLFCNICKQIEPFNLMTVKDIQDSAPSPEDKDSKIIQIFSLSYLCQSCKTIPEVFLIRREGFRLILSGRTPIEHVDVPKVIPESIRKFYSGAVVAYQSGHTLAGNFYLRTLLEQWARLTINDSTSKADTVMDKYMSTLPEDFKQRFASMRDLYGRLSEDIHNANGSDELFDNTLKQIEEHFDARKLYKLN